MAELVILDCVSRAATEDSDSDLELCGNASPVVGNHPKSSSYNDIHSVSSTDVLYPVLDIIPSSLTVNIAGNSSARVREPSAVVSIQPVAPDHLGSPLTSPPVELTPSVRRSLQDHSNAVNSEEPPVRKSALDVASDDSPCVRLQSPEIVTLDDSDSDTAPTLPRARSIPNSDAAPVLPCARSVPNQKRGGPPVLQPEMYFPLEDEVICLYEDPPTLLPEIALTRRRHGIVRKRNFFGEIVNSEEMTDEAALQPTTSGNVAATEQLNTAKKYTAATSVPGPAHKNAIPSRVRPAKKGLGMRKQTSPRKREVTLQPKLSKKVVTLKSKPAKRDAALLGRKSAEKGETVRQPSSVTKENSTVASLMKVRLQRVEDSSGAMSVKRKLLFGTKTLIVKPGSGQSHGGSGKSKSIKKRCGGPHPLMRTSSNKKASSTLCSTDLEPSEMRQKLASPRGKSGLQRMGSVNKSPGDQTCSMQANAGAPYLPLSRTDNIPPCTGWKSLMSLPRPHEIVSHCGYAFISGRAREAFAPLSPSQGEMFAPDMGCVKGTSAADQSSEPADGIFSCPALDRYMIKESSLKLSFPVPGPSMPYEPLPEGEILPPPPVSSPAHPPPPRRCKELQFKTVLEKQVWLGLREESDLKKIRMPPVAREPPPSEALPLYALLRPPRYPSEARTRRHLVVPRAGKLLPLAKVLNPSREVRRRWDAAERRADCIQFVYHQCRQLKIRGSVSPAAPPSVKMFGRMVRENSVERRLNAWKRHEYAVKTRDVSRADARAAVAAIVASPAMPAGSGAQQKIKQDPQCVEEVVPACQSSQEDQKAGFPGHHSNESIETPTYESVGNTDGSESQGLIAGADHQASCQPAPLMPSAGSRGYNESPEEKIRMTPESQVDHGTMEEVDGHEGAQTLYRASCPEANYGISEGAGLMSPMRLLMVQNTGMHDVNPSASNEPACGSLGLVHGELDGQEEMQSPQGDRVSVGGCTYQESSGKVSSAVLSSMSASEAPKSNEEKEEIPNGAVEKAANRKLNDENIETVKPHSEMRDDEKLGTMKAGCENEDHDRRETEKARNEALGHENVHIAGAESAEVDHKHGEIVVAEYCGDNAGQRATGSFEDDLDNTKHMNNFSENRIGDEINLAAQAGKDMLSGDGARIREKDGEEAYAKETTGEESDNAELDVEDWEDKKSFDKELSRGVPGENECVGHPPGEKDPADDQANGEGLHGEMFNKTSSHVRCVNSSQTANGVGEHQAAARSYEVSPTTCSEASGTECVSFEGSTNENTPAHTTAQSERCIEGDVQTLKNNSYVLQPEKPASEVKVELSPPQDSEAEVTENNVTSITDSSKDILVKRIVQTLKEDRWMECSKGSANPSIEGVNSKKRREPAFGDDGPTVGLPRYRLMSVRPFCLLHKVHDCPHYRPGGECFISASPCRLSQYGRNIAIRTGHRLRPPPPRQEHAARTFGRVTCKRPIESVPVRDSCCLVRRQVADGTSVHERRDQSRRCMPLPHHISISSITGVVLITSKDATGRQIQVHGVYVRDRGVEPLMAWSPAVGVPWWVDMTDDVTVVSADGRRFRNPPDRGNTVPVDVSGGGRLWRGQMTELNQKLAAGLLSVADSAAGEIKLVTRPGATPGPMRLRRVEAMRRAVFSDGEVLAFREGKYVMTVLGAVSCPPKPGALSPRTSDSGGAFSGEMSSGRANQSSDVNPPASRSHVPNMDAGADSSGRPTSEQPHDVDVVAVKCEKTTTLGQSLTSPRFSGSDTPQAFTPLKLHPSRTSGMKLAVKTGFPGSASGMCLQWLPNSKQRDSDPSQRLVTESGAPTEPQLQPERSNSVTVVSPPPTVNHETNVCNNDPVSLPSAANTGAPVRRRLSFQPDHPDAGSPVATRTDLNHLAGAESGDRIPDVSAIPGKSENGTGPPATPSDPSVNGSDIVLSGSRIPLVNLTPMKKSVSQTDQERSLGTLHSLHVKDRDSMEGNLKTPHSPPTETCDARSLYLGESGSDCAADSMPPISVLVEPEGEEPGKQDGGRTHCSSDRQDNPGKLVPRLTLKRSRLVEIRRNPKSTVKCEVAGKANNTPAFQSDKDEGQSLAEPLSKRSFIPEKENSVNVVASFSNQVKCELKTGVSVELAGLAKPPRKYSTVLNFEPSSRLPSKLSSTPALKPSFKSEFKDTVEVTLKRSFKPNLKRSFKLELKRCFTPEAPEVLSPLISPMKLGAVRHGLTVPQHRGISHRSPASPALCSQSVRTSGDSAESKIIRRWSATVTSPPDLNPREPGVSEGESKEPRVPVSPVPRTVTVVGCTASSHAAVTLPSRSSSAGH